MLPFPDPQKVAPLLEHVPSRARAAIEVVFVAAFVLTASLATSYVLAGALVVAGFVLVRPWNAAHGSRVRRALSALVLLPALVVPTLLGRTHDTSGGRRIGIELEPSATLPGDPPHDGGIAKIVNVVPDSPGAGRLFVGDRIVALGGRALDANDPIKDVVARVGSEDLPVDTSIDVIRDAAQISVPLHVPWPAGARTPPSPRVMQTFVEGHLFVALAVRSVCLIVLVFLLARANGQSLRQLGLLRAGALRESAMGIPGALGAFAMNVIVAIPIALVGLLAGHALERDMSTRAEGLKILTAQGTGLTGLLAFALTAVFAASFEEIAFRGFLLPRLRILTGSWVVAVVLASAAFASGHVYEGVAALFQTFALGVYFSAILLWRGRLEAAITAHIAFNVAMFSIITILDQSGVLKVLEKGVQK